MFEKLGTITGVYHNAGRQFGSSAVNFNDFSVPGMSTNSPAMGTNNPADNTPMPTEGAMTSVPVMTTPLVVGVSFTVCFYWLYTTNSVSHYFMC